MRSLEDKISEHASVLDMLKNAPSGFYPFPVPAEHTNWRLEQLAWEQSAVLFDQSYHMTDLYLSGLDKLRILSDVSINNFASFEQLSAKHIVVCSDSGYIVGDAVAFHLQDASINVVGKPSCANFIEYFARSGGYDVTMRKDIRLVEGTGRRECYRFQLLGPNAYEILKKVADTPIPDMRFFGMYELRIAKQRVTAFRHGMAKAPGVEIWGSYSERDAILDALLEAGEEYELCRGGARVYSTAGPESGWVGAVLPAVYSGNEMAAYRSWLTATSYEATLSVGGSLDSDRIEDYYFDPWDLGYHRFIHWDHEFKGRDALCSRRDGPPPEEDMAAMGSRGRCSNPSIDARSGNTLQIPGNACGPLRFLPAGQGRDWKSAGGAFRIRRIHYGCRRLVLHWHCERCRCGPGGDS